MANVKRISIKVTPDTSSFNKDLKAALAKIKQEFDVKATLQVDTAKATAAIDKWRKTQDAKPAVKQKVDVDTKKWDAALRTANKHLGSFNAGLLTAAKRAGIVAVALGAVGGAMNVMRSVGPILVQAVGAAGILPGALAATVGIAATLKVGVQGVGDAISNAFDPSKANQFNEAMAKLAPNAKNFVRALQSLHKPFKDLQQLVQNNLFAGMGDQIKKIANGYLPVLRKGMGGLATDINGITKRFITMASSARSIRDTSVIFDNTRKSMSGLGTVLVNLGDAFRSISVVGSSFLPQLSNAAADASKKFANFIDAARKSGQLKQWMQGGIDAFRQLWQVIKDLTVITTTVFHNISVGAGGLTGIFGGATAAVRAFVTSAQGLRVFQSLGAIFGAAGNALRQVLTAALQQLGPIIVALSPFLQTLVSYIGVRLANAINVVGPKLQAMAKWLSDNRTWVVPLAAGIGVLTIALQGFVKVSKGITAVSTAMNVFRGSAARLPQATASMEMASSSGSKLGGILKGALKGGLVAAAVGVVALVASGKDIGPTINQMSDTIVNFAKNLPQLVQAVVAKLPGLLTQLGTALSSALPTIANALAQAIPRIIAALVAVLPPLIQTFVQVIPRIVTALAAAVPQLVSAVVSIIPRIIQGLVGVIPTLVQAFVSMIPPVITAIVNALPGIVNAFVTAIPQIITAVVNAIPSIVNAFVNAIPPIITAVVNAIPGIVNAFVSAIPRIIGALLGALPKIVTAIVSVFPKIITAVIGALPRVIDAFVSAIPRIIGALLGALPKIVTAIISVFPKIVGAIIRAIPQVVATFIKMIPQIIASLVREAPRIGIELIKGFWNGLAQMGQWILNKIGEFFGSLIPGWVKNILGIHSPSRVFAGIGQFAGMGFAVGMTDSLPDIKKAAAGMKDTATKAANLDDLGNTFSGNLVRTVSADLHATASSPEFASLPDRIATALSGMEIRMDANGMAKMVNKVNKQNRNR